MAELSGWQQAFKAAMRLLTVAGGILMGVGGGSAQRPFLGRQNAHAVAISSALLPAPPSALTSVAQNGGAGAGVLSAIDLNPVKMVSSPSCARRHARPLVHHTSYPTAAFNHRWRDFTFSYWAC